MGSMSLPEHSPEAVDLAATIVLGTIVAVIGVAAFTFESLYGHRRRG